MHESFKLHHELTSTRLQTGHAALQFVPTLTQTTKLPPQKKIAYFCTPYNVIKY